MKTEDKSRKWMWAFLAGMVALQMYFVWELLAVFALFCSGIRCDRRSGGDTIYARQDLGRGSGAPRREQASGAGGRAAGDRYRGRYGAPSVSAVLAPWQLVNRFEEILASARAHAETVTLLPSGMKWLLRQKSEKKKCQPP